MNQTVFSSLGEVCYDEKLDWGLPIYVVPKSGFTRCSARLALSLENSSVTPELSRLLAHVIAEQGERTPLPPGSIGVFAAPEQVIYTISAPDRFPEALGVLLRSVFSPDLSPERIKRLRGGLSWAHSRSEKLPNSDSQTLNQAYRALYRPERMVLCVSGGVDPRRVFSVARSISPAVRIEEPSPPSSCRTEPGPASCLTLADQGPAFRLSVPDPIQPAGPLALRRVCLAQFSAQLLAGESSHLFHSLLMEGLAGPGLRVRHPDALCPPIFLLEGKSRDPEALCRRLSEAARAYARRLDRELFQRLRLRVYGRWLAALDEPEQLCRQLAQGHFGGYQPLDFGQALLSLTLEEVQAFCGETLAPALDSPVILTAKGATPL